MPEILRTIFVYTIFYAAFYAAPVVLGILLPLFLSLLISQKIVFKKISWTKFLLFGCFTIGLTILTNVIWNNFVYNHIYYELDRILLTPFTLMFHEAPVLDASVSWIAFGWTLFQLDLLYYIMLIILYSVALGISLIWLKSDKQKSEVLKTETLACVLLLIAAIFLPKIITTSSDLLYKQFPQTKREEKFSICPTNNESRVYFGGDGFDYISDINGKSITKVWSKNGSGFANGIVSPDGSKIVYVEQEGLWIRCANSDGQYKIPFEERAISGLKRSPYDLIQQPSWSPDSNNLVFNYAGDLITINTETREKKVVYPNIALRDYGIDHTKPRPTGFLAFFETGNVYWAKDNSIFYIKYTDSGAELRRLLSRGDDIPVITSQYNLWIDSISSDSKRIVYWERNWQTPGSANFNQRYLYNLDLKQKEVQIYDINFNSDNSFYWSPNNRYILSTNTGIGYVDQYDSLVLISYDTESKQTTNIKQKIKEYLQNQNLMKKNEAVTIETRGWSRDNNLLIYVMFNDGNYFDRNITLVTDAYGNNISIVHQNTKDNPPGNLMPVSWL